MATAILSPSAKQQFFLNDGSPAAGAKLHTYAANTTTPQATYTDRAGLVANANPIILDARGEAVVYLTPGLVYDYVLRLADNTLVWTREDVVADLGDADSIEYTREDGSKAPLQDIVREPLTASRTYYVRTDGNDANNGRTNTAGGAWLTLQRAVNHIRDNLDLNGFNVTVQVANGTYTGGMAIAQPWVGKGTVFFIGNTTTPASCIINTTGDCFYAEKGATFDVRGFKVLSATGRGITAFSGSFVSVGVMEFGAVGGAHVEVGTGGQVLLASDYTISGGGSSHLHAGAEGQIFTGVIAVTVTGTPNFSAYFAGAAQGSIICKDAIFTGAATGARFLSHKNGTIEGHPAFTNPFPGDVEGRVWGGFMGASTARPLAYQASPSGGASLVLQGFRGISQTFVTHFQCATSLSGESLGAFFCNDDNCYSTGRTHFASTVNVLVNSGTTNGWSFNNSTNVGAGAEVFSASASNNPIGYMRRQGTDGAILGFNKGNTSVGSISVTTTNTAYNVSCDERMKDWIGGGYDPEWIGKVAAEFGRYTFKHDPDKVVQFGPRAQRLALVEPTAVTPGIGEPDEEGFIPWGVDMSKLVPKLLAEVAALRKRVEALEAQ